MQTFLTVLMSLTLAASAVAQSRQGGGSRGSSTGEAHWFSGGGVSRFNGGSVSRGIVNRGFVSGGRFYGRAYYGGYGYPYGRYYYAPYYAPYYYAPYAPYYYAPYYYAPYYYGPYAYGYPYGYYAPLVPRVPIAIRPGVIVGGGWRTFGPR